MSLLQQQNWTEAETRAPRPCFRSSSRRLHDVHIQPRRRPASGYKQRPTPNCFSSWIQMGRRNVKATILTTGRSG